MYNIYIYAIDTMADWEMGHIMAELNSRRFFKKDAPEVALKFAGISRAPIKTMGGLTIFPDCTVADTSIAENSVLLLPGANTWQEANHAAILDRAAALLGSGGTVCAICGATAALASRGLLDARAHTSNGPGYLEMAAPGYMGAKFYIERPSVADGNLITASATGSLMWTRQILARLNVFRPDTLEAWYAYFSTGNPDHFFAMMRSLQ